MRNVSRHNEHLAFFYGLHLTVYNKRTLAFHDLNHRIERGGVFAQALSFIERKEGYVSNLFFSRVLLMTAPSA